MALANQCVVPRDGTKLTRQFGVTVSRQAARVKRKRVAGARPVPRGVRTHPGALPLGIVITCPVCLGKLRFIGIEKGAENTKAPYLGRLTQIQRFVLVVIQDSLLWLAKREEWCKTWGVLGFYEISANTFPGPPETRLGLESPGSLYR
jgi:hypothetical protein